MDKSEVRWATVEDRNIAYQLTGAGEDVVLLFDFWATNLDRDWDWPPNARVLRRFETAAQLLRFDRSGMGLSDRAMPAPKEAIGIWAAEAAAVLDSLEIARVKLVAGSWTATVALEFAARGPVSLSTVMGVVSTWTRSTPIGAQRGVLRTCCRDSGTATGVAFGVILDGVTRSR